MKLKRFGHIRPNLAAHLFGALLIAGLFAQPASAKERLLVFAAASMKNVLDDIKSTYEKSCDCQIIYSYAGSGLLAKQIASGAPANFYISADQSWADWLKSKPGMNELKSTVIARNRLVIVTGKGRKISAELIPEALLAAGRFAMGEPRGVPAGRYAKSALSSLNLWDNLSGNAVFTENVRVALLMVARGDLGAAIVYQSDSLIEPRVKTAFIFPETLHPPIQYTGMALDTKPSTMKFQTFLGSKQVQQLFVDHGFSASPSKTQKKPDSSKQKS